MIRQKSSSLGNVSLALIEEEVKRIIASSSSLEILPKCLTGRNICRVVLSDLGKLLECLNGAFILLRTDTKNVGVGTSENCSQAEADIKIAVLVR